MGDSDTGYATINSTKVYYEFAGEGEALILLHAGIADSRMWDAQFEAFAEHFWVIRYDLRGFGKSKLPSGTFTGYGDVVSLLDYLRVKKAHIVGISNGGRVALDFSIAFPQRVNKLILATPSVGGHPPSNAIKQFWADEEEALQRGDLNAATELNLRLWVDGPSRSPMKGMRIFGRKYMRCRCWHSRSMNRMMLRRRGWSRRQRGG